MLVSGPTPTSHVPGRRRHVSMMNSMASVPSSGRRRRGEVGAVEPARSVHGRRGTRLLDQRSGGAAVHGHVDVEQLAHDERVVRGAVERGVAGHRRDAEQLGVAGGDDDGDGVVVARITVEQHRHGTVSPSVEPSVLDVGFPT